MSAVLPVEIAISMHRRRAVFVLASLVMLAVVAMAWALAAGEVGAGLVDILEALIGGDSTAATVVRELRLPRAFAAFACGGLLALAGALMQVLLRNPLADPYVLGVSGGAAVAALGAMMAGAAGLWVDTAAFIGALTAMICVFGLARGNGSWTPARLLLTGVVVAAGCGAVVSLMLTLAPDRALRGMLFWMMGDAGSAAHPWPALVGLTVGLVVSFPAARELNLLARGEKIARSLGVATLRLRLGVFIVASLLTALAVTTVGAVGFVGLVVPHLLRLSIGNDQRLLLPGSALAGGCLLLVADTLARTIVAPVQLPVGVLTALIGVPVFLWLLSRGAR